jgi:hypothetical protein
MKRSFLFFENRDKESETEEKPGNKITERANHRPTEREEGPRLVYDFDSDDHFGRRLSIVRMEKGEIPDKKKKPNTDKGNRQRGEERVGREELSSSREPHTQDPYSDQEEIKKFDNKEINGEGNRPADKSGRL